MKNKEKYNLTELDVLTIWDDVFVKLLVYKNDNKICEMEMDTYDLDDYALDIVETRFYNKWLEQEYKEPIKLTRNEKAILESLDDKWKWIARDEQDNGLVVFPTKPKKEEAWWSGQGCWDLMLFNHLFQFIEWSDEKPYSIEELLKCEVVDDE
jgi:hypothetical protein